MSKLAKIILGAGLALAAVSPALADDRGDYDRYERRYEDQDLRRDARDGYAYGRGRGRGDGVMRLTNLIRRDDRLIDWAFMEFDRNRNGRLEAREADDANKTFFYAADRNRSGYIEGREFSYGRDQVLRNSRYAYRR